MEHLKNNYFVLVRLFLMVTFSIYGITEKSRESGVSAWILLLASLFIAVMAFGELLPEEFRFVSVLLGIGVFAVMMALGEKNFILLGFFSAYELLSLFKNLNPKLYFLPIAGIFIPSSVPLLTVLVSTVLMTVCYLQHNFVIRSYKKQMMEDTITEQNLKRDMQEKEFAAKMEQRKSMLLAENQILEERASLSQTLHDKLGHNINGSVYQLEAAKVLMEKDPEKSQAILQAVIDQLRSGMNEIRGILRKERPAKKELAMLQLYKLCEDCNNKGVKTELMTEGDTALIPDPIWEVILDNAFEAVSNSMKYSKCSSIDIQIFVMKQRVRVSIADDGIGCSKFEDGMGISGMRSRVRAASGTIDFQTDPGFSVTMLLPI